MTKQPLALLLLGGTLMLALACGEDRATPVTPTTPNVPAAPPAAPVVRPTSLTLSGTVAFEAPGETSQLTATAGYADGTTRDVTREAQWTTSSAFIASISTDGVLTARGLGLTSVLVRFPVTNPSLFRSAQVIVTPAGTFTASGRVREPGAGGLGGALLLHLGSGQTATSSSDGYYHFGGLTGDARFYVTRAEFEDAEVELVRDAFGDVPLQRVVHVAAGGETYSGRLAPNDMDYMADGTSHCQPCRMIRVTSDGAGLVRIRLTWTGSAAMAVWVGGQMIVPGDTAREVVADVLVTAGDARIYVGTIRSDSEGDYIAFTVTATRPEGGE
jgi:hypothetical protein